jgi:hypothetical protein
MLIDDIADDITVTVAFSITQITLIILKSQFRHLTEKKRQIILFTIAVLKKRVYLSLELRLKTGLQLQRKAH